MSLRGRLVLLMVALVALGVVVSDLVAAAALRSVLRDQIEDSLDGAVPYAQRMLTGETAIDPMPPPQAGSPETPSMELRAGRLDATGALVGDPVGLFSRDGTPFLAIPPARLAATSGGGTLRFDARLAGERYRVLLAPLAGTGDVMALIISLRDVDDTLGRLQWVHLLVAEGLLAGVAGLGWLLVRLGLRPLRHMADTADAVAAGAVDSRVEVSGGAEVARLGAALNAAFDARWESEARLRTFVADASHELRTPLSAIRGYAELVRSGALGGDEANRALERVESEAARMGNLVGDLLTLTSCDRQRPLTLVPLELTALAAEALADAAAVEPGRPSRLVALHPVAVIADEAYVRQVLSNLLANVRHHTAPEVPVEVRVSAGRDTARV
ncbi:MAG: sensor histidine kinase, partial [Acidimicrobiia bacterium]